MYDTTTLHNIFKAYDIRGLYPEQLNKDFAYKLGRSFVAVTGAKQVAVGRDMRTSSEELFEGLCKGLQEQGANIIDLGMISTDMLYFACGKHEYETGIMITASHNPPQYGGFKMCYKKAAPLPSQEGNEFAKMISYMTDDQALPESNSKGSIAPKDVSDEWVEHVLSFISPDALQPMKIVIDAGNGMAGPIIKKLQAKLPMLDVVPMYFEPDGTFPHHLADPSKEENLQDLKAKMKEEHADLGMAFDGDADRVFLVDAEGKTLSGTLTTAMVAKSLLEKSPNKTILYNAICGKVVPELVKEMGGTSARTRVGHTLIKQKMQELQADFAGEHSGHYFFKDNWNADSGIIAAMIILELLSKKQQPLHELRKEFERYDQGPETNFRVESIDKVLGIVQEHFKDLEQDMLDGLSVHATDWWCNVRPSNTEPVLRLNVEAKDKATMEAKLQEISDLIQSIQ